MDSNKSLRSGKGHQRTWKNRKLTVGYLIATDNITGLSSEEQAGWSFLQSCKLLKLSITPILHLSTTPVASLPALLWWHFDSSTAIPAIARDPKAILAIRKYLNRGGNLLLTLLATQYVVPLGLETRPPNVIRKGIWDEQCWAKDYPDIRGHAAFQGHPIFAGLHGACFTWNPKPGTSFAAAYYEAPEIPQDGRVIAVERQYIRLNEARRTVVEYPSGRGKVLAIGMHMHFDAKENPFRAHMERLIENCFMYLIEGNELRARNQNYRYWDFGARTVQQVKRSSLSVRLSKIPWRTQESGLKLEREKATTNQFDVGGRRILIVGTEQDGVEEVWTHPVRILRNIRIGFRVGSDLRWSESFSPKVTARPESFTREFSLGTCTIRETTFANLDRPSGGIHFEVHGENLEILITGEIDLRMMWPLSENATGSLEYSVSNGFEKVVVQNNSGKLCAIVGCSHNSVQILVDHGKPFVNSDGSLQFKPTSAAVVAFGMRIRPGGQTSHCTMCFSGSHQGLGEAEKAYRAFMRSPVMAYNKQVTYYKRLLASLPKLRVASDMLEAFKWAAVSLDRFFVETPGVGQSLMAGYSTTRSGWGGGHAISGRPGYAWYFGRDAVWSCLALLALKRYKQVRAVLEFLGRYQDINGKILHECTTSGFVHYDAADSTTLYVYLIGRYLRATNDKKFAKTQFPKILKAMEFCFGTDRDGDHLIENTGVGHGWVEGGPLFPAHAELYLNACWAAALQEATYVAQRLKRRKEQVEWKTERAIVNQIINEEFWDHETGLYNYAKNSDGSFKTEKTILPAVAMLFALTDPRKAGACLEEYASEKFSTDWGVRLIGRESSSYNPEGYHYGSIWPLFTGWAALASFAMGRQDLALKHVGRNLSLHRRFSLGCMPEVLHGERCDVAGLCARQAWSEAMVVLGVVGAVNRGE